MKQQEQIVEAGKHCPVVNSKKNYSIPIEDRLSEIYKLEKEIQTYQKILLNEGFKIGKKQNITFFVKKIDNEYDDLAPIIELAKETLPSLYRKYKQAIKSLINKVEDLEKKVEN